MGYNYILAQEGTNDILFNTGNKHFENQDYINALDSYLDILHDNEDNSITLKITYKIGNCYYRLENFDKALKYFLKTLEIAKKNNDTNFIIKSNLNLSNTYFRSKLIKQSIKTINNALFFFKEYKSTDSILLTKLFINKGRILGELKQFDEALTYYDKARKINYKSVPENEKKTIINNLNAIYNNMGVILKEQGKHQKAINHFRLATKQALKTNDEYNVALSDLNIALVYASLKKIDSSRLYTHNALNKFMKLKRPYFIKDCYKNLAELELDKGNYKGSLEFYKLHHKFKDSVINIKQIQESLQHLNNYTVNLINNKSELKSEIKESQYQSKIWFWSLLSILLALTSLIMFLFFNRAKKNKNLAYITLKNNELEQQILTQEINLKNNKLSELSSHIISKNEVLQQLKKAIKILKKENQLEVSPILNEISQQINLESERKELEVFINEKHTEFFFKLKQKHPDLTKKDLRLSSLILTGLSSKEIATLLNISSSSVDMSRYRLRKKMNIPSKKSISIFLSEI